MMNYPLFEVTNLHSYYGDSHILQGINLEIYSGEIVVLVGRQGAGKTTLLLSLMGIHPLQQGKIILNGVELSGLPSWKIAQQGVGLVPENRRIFPDLTVEENLEVAAESKRINENLSQAYTDFPELKALRFQRARNLSGGQQQMLTIARTLIRDPKLILMDEPTEGLAPVLIQRIQQVIQHLKNRGKTVLITGQNITFALDLASTVYILDTGIIQWKGSIQMLNSNPNLLWNYLGIKEK